MTRLKRVKSNNASYKCSSSSSSSLEQREHERNYFHKNDVANELLKEIDEFKKNVITSPRIVGLFTFYHQFLLEELNNKELNEYNKELNKDLTNKELNSLKNSNEVLQENYSEEILQLIEMFPHLDVLQIVNIYKTIANEQLNMAIELLINIDQQDIQQQSTLQQSLQQTLQQNHTLQPNNNLLQQEQEIIHYNNNDNNIYNNNLNIEMSIIPKLLKVTIPEMDIHISELEIEFLTNYNMKNSIKEELGILDEEEENSQNALQNSLQNNKPVEEMDSQELELHLQWKAKLEILQKERKLMQIKILEEKRKRNVKFYCKEELEHLCNFKNSNIVKRYLFNFKNHFEMNAEDIHFRIVESQFYRTSATFSAGYGNNYFIESVEYLVNPLTIKKFNECKLKLAKEHSFLPESMNCYLLFHGTNDTNMENIIKTNFLLEKIGSATDMGFYGKGFYFSENPLLSIGYSRGNQYLLLCLVMVGKAFRMSTVQTGRPKEPGYDSHTSPDGCQEVIIFNPDQIIPMYKVKYAQRLDCNYDKNFM
ncbi:hypothetical protein ABK040_013457 [Willaertia magna]